MEGRVNFPKISIVTPVYNMAKFLPRTIESIISQEYSNFEYIIVDGGSTDGGIEIIKKYKNLISFWISEPDKGQSDAINKGFKKATGDLLCWVNADDVLFPGTLKKIAMAYYQNPNLDIITGNIVYIDENDYIIRCIRVPKMRWFFYRRNVGYFCAPAVFFKKGLYENVGALDINLHFLMDVDLWHKFRLANAMVYHIKEYLGAFRIHISSKTFKLSEKRNKIFENPETAMIRMKYLPRVSENTVRLFRIFYKIWQVFNLKYFWGWIDFQRWKGKTWQEIFVKK